MKVNGGMTCNNCPLAKSRTKIVWGEGPSSPRVILIGEAPGKDEDREGRPFVGKAGKELDNYLWLFAKMNREDCYVTNIVKCRPPNNRDPKPEEIEACGRHLYQELGDHPEASIVTLGRFAASWFLGPVDMTVIHGIPQVCDEGTILPIYHPAAGLHNSRMMISLQRDFEALGKWVRGELEVPVDEFLEPDYREAWTFSIAPFIGIDTEAYSDGRLWSIQWSHTPGTGYICGENFTPTFGEDKVAVIHNAPYDLPQLAQAGVHPPNWVDTMSMAYLLQDEPQGLKALAYRHCGMHMQSYEEVVRDATEEKALQYLERASKLDYPDADPVGYRTPSGDWRVRQPQNIGRRIQTRLRKFYKEGCDLFLWWDKVKQEEGKGLVEERLGPLREADLSNVYATDPTRAVTYGCRDADATLRIYPKLMERVRGLGLEDALSLDQSIIPMLLDMMSTGMPVNKEGLYSLSSRFGKHVDDVQERIEDLLGSYVNPASPLEVMKLLPKLGIKKLRSTEAKYLEGVKDQHPVVPLILEYREYQKLKGTYCDPIPKMLDSDNRLHTRLSLTTTATGRLASREPNLQNVPVRSDEGREIRGCFEAPEGRTFLSVDYSQIELRLLAHESQDPIMLEVYRKGDDLHAKTAQLVFGLRPDDVDEYKHRRPAKTCNFAVVYGITPRGLSDQLQRDGVEAGEWSEDRCEEFIQSWFSVYKGVGAFMRDQYVGARRYGYIRSLAGRIRRIPEVKSVLPYVVRSGEREAGNHPIQGGAQDIMKMAMRDLTPVYQDVHEKHGYCRPLIQIHDDLVWEVDEEIWEWVYYLFKEIMESCIDLTIPLAVDGKVGKYWGSMEKVK